MHRVHVFAARHDAAVAISKKIVRFAILVAVLKARLAADLRDDPFPSANMSRREDMLVGIVR